MIFKVADEFFEKLPTACFGVVLADGLDNGKAYPEIDTLLDTAIQSAAEAFAGKKVKEEPEIIPYREAFRTLGINPNKFLCSIEALFTRIAKGKGMPHINPIVDLGNAVSLKYALPIGAHDMQGAEEIDVRPSVAGDTFLPFGDSIEEAPNAGEMVYAVGSQVRTRRWTWRQSEHGKITADTTTVFFPIDGFTDVNLDKVTAARDDLAAQLTAIFGCKTFTGLVDSDNREIRF
ncbi:MAG: B3/4 domain-containing protein [Lachnospiraceae bacterium]|jgi:DNA/RNA-binding domain of Phe-tRNA-synthetase-like protein